MLQKLEIHFLLNILWFNIKPWSNTIKNHFQHNLDEIQPSPYFIRTDFNTDIFDSHTNNLDIMPELTLYTQPHEYAHIIKSYDWYEHISGTII